MIELQGVTKLYGTVIGVNDIHLSLPQGAYGLLGPNGSGKTTLINLVTGQLRPTIGRVKLFDKNPWNRTELMRRIGLCPAVDILHPNVSSYDWVRYLIELNGYSRIEAAERAEHALFDVGLAGAMHRPMGGYSLGMRQRTKLAQAFAHEPELLILDEPFNGLDPVGRHEMTEVLRKWIQQGKSLILASHILHEVEAISPAFLLICGGRLLASGTSEEVESMLAEVPNEVLIRSQQVTQLAQLLVVDETIESVRFEGSDQLVISTRNPLELFQALAVRLRSSDVVIDELRSADDSLQNLFSTLMRIHRGEI